MRVEVKVREGRGVGEIVEGGVARGGAGGRVLVEGGRGRGLCVWGNGGGVVLTHLEGSRIG